MYNIEKVKSVLRDMRAINDMHKIMNNGAEIHKVNLLRYIFNVRPGRSLKYRAACKFYEWAKGKNYL